MGIFSLCIIRYMQYLPNETCQENVTASRTMHLTHEPLVLVKRGYPEIIVVSS